MTWHVALQDAALYVFLIAGVSLYGIVLEHKAKEADKQAEKTRRTVSTRIALRFRQYSILVVSSWMVVGALYQVGVVSTPFAAVLFALSLAISVLGLIRLRQYIK